MDNLDAPLVIGGSGGSGTRVVAQLLMLSDFYMGLNQNDSCDALDFSPFYERWVNEYNFGRISMSEQAASCMRSEFEQHLVSFQNGMTDGTTQWGWKNPRSMLVLPFLDSVLPDLRFIHVVRDGRDMAWSKNKNQLNKHGEVILTAGVCAETSETRAMRFWSESNMLVAEYGEQEMGGRYIRIKFEDLCLDYENVLSRLEKFLGRKMNTSEFSKYVRLPDSVGRWRGESLSDQDKFFCSGEPAMRHFSYLKEGD